MLILAPPVPGRRVTKSAQPPETLKDTPNGAFPVHLEGFSRQKRARNSLAANPGKLYNQGGLDCVVKVDSGVEFSVKEE